MKISDDFLTIRNVAASSDLNIRIEPQATVDHAKCMENVEANCKLDIPWLDTLDFRGGTAIICGAGPSLKDTVAEVRAAQNNGGIVFACNSAAQFLMGHGILVNYQVVLEPSAEQLDEMVDAEQHLLASICDPSVFAACKNPILWHPLIHGIEGHIPAGKSFAGIGGGYTVTTCVLGIAEALGFEHFHLYGVDSSYRGGSRYMHGAVNERRLTLPVSHAGVEYYCDYDLKRQIPVFFMLFEALRAKGCTMDVHGSGLFPEVYKSMGAEVDKPIVYDTQLCPPAYGEYLLTLMFARYAKLSGNTAQFRVRSGQHRPDWNVLTDDEQAKLLADYLPIAKCVLKEDITIDCSDEYRYPLPVYGIAMGKLNTLCHGKDNAFMNRFLLSAEDFAGCARRTIYTPYVTMGARYSEKWEPHRNLTDTEFVRCWEELANRFPGVPVMVVSDRIGCRHFRDVAEDNGMPCLFSKDYSDTFEGDAELILRSRFFYILRGGGIGIVPLFSNMAYEMHFDPLFHKAWSDRQYTSWARPWQVYKPISNTEGEKCN